MPIKDLSNRLPVIGQIRKGDKDDRGYPVELDHFRVIFNPAEKEAERIFREAYGETPTEIRVMLPSNDVSQVWDAWLMAFQGKTLVAKADGERYWYKVDTRTGEVVVQDGQPLTPYQRGAVEYSYTIKKGDRAGQQQEVRCSPRARLYVIVQELFEAGYMSCLEFHTGSWNDIQNIENQIKMMDTMSKGQMAYTPLVLLMYPDTIMRTMEGGRKAEKKTHLVRIEINPDYARLAMARMRANRLPAGEPQEVDDWEPGTDPGPYEDGDYDVVETSTPGSWKELWEQVNAGAYPGVTGEEVSRIAFETNNDLSKTFEQVREYCIE